jgi:hypothetical protein
MNTKTLTTLFLSILALAAPAGASAAVRHASPSGSGPVASCPASDPCSLSDALDYDYVHDGDEISIAPGNYVTTADLGTDKAITIHGAPGAARPRITSSAGTFLYVDDPNAVVRDLIVDHTNSFTGLFLAHGSAERVEVRSSGTACYLRTALIRDSVCFSRDGIGLRSGTANAAVDTVQLRNVTAVSAGSGPGAWGIYVDAQQGNHVTVDSKSVIASGDDESAGDVYASGGSGGASAGLQLTGSNYDTAFVTGSATVPDPGSGSNQTAAPLFVNAAAGDLHQAAGSPTIDAGTTDELTGTLDADGAPRVHGDALDIGAYEFVPAPQTPPAPPQSAMPAPDTTIVSGPAAKTRRRAARFEFEAGGPASRYECSLDGAAYAPCSSPASLRVKRGRHVFRVRAVGGGGADPTPAEARWRVLRKHRGR